MCSALSSRPENRLNGIVDFQAHHVLRPCLNFFAGSSSFIAFVLAQATGLRVQQHLCVTTLPANANSAYATTGIQMRRVGILPPNAAIPAPGQPAPGRDLSPPDRPRRSMHGACAPRCRATGRLNGHTKMLLRWLG